MKKFSLRSKLIFLISIVLIPMIILYLVRVESFYKYNIEHELESNKQLVEAISTSFMNYIEEVWTQETTLNTIFAKKPGLPHDEIQYYLKEALINQNIVAAYSWVSPKGVVLGSTRGDLIGRSLIEREYCKRIINGENKVVSNLVIGYSTNKPVIPIAKAIRENGNLVGFMVATIEINNLAEKLPSPVVMNDSRFGIVDKDGYRVYQSDLRNYNYNNLRITKTSLIWQALNGKVVMASNRLSGFDNTTRMGVYMPIKQIGWACFFTTPYQKVTEKYKKELLNDLIVMFVVTLLSLLAAFYLGSLDLSRLKKLKDTANLIVDGNYSARVGLSGYDEISATAQAFDHMAEGIENYDKLKTQFFINMSHELKTPINVIFSSVQLIEQKKSNVEIDEYLGALDKHSKILRQNCYRLTRLVNNLIDITRYENGFLKVKLGIHNIVEIIEEITMSIVKYAESKGIEILFDTDIEEKYILCDPDIIERIMLNLFSNALKFTNKNGKISVNIYDKGDIVNIKVKDSGIGIPGDKLGIIFERFRQVDNSLNRNHEGSGIGLSLVKTLVEAHNGTISVDSTLGIGTEFTIFLPASELPESDYSECDLNNNPQGLIERINIEFSDIYSLGDFD